MKCKYKVFSCNNGNPTAIITNYLSEENKKYVSDKIYDRMPEIDQAVMIIDVKENTCTFQLINGEFCGNACLAVCEYMKKEHDVSSPILINRLIDDESKIHYIEIKGYSNKEYCRLSIPKKMLINNVEFTKSGIYKVEMNGITHLVIPKNFDKNDESIAGKEKDLFASAEKMPEVLGIIFLEENKINPFIWIDRIELLQHQTSCLSGSIASTTYINKINSNDEEVMIIQPTGESYRIKIEDNSISVVGKVRCIDSGEIDI